MSKIELPKDFECEIIFKLEDIAMEFADSKNVESTGQWGGGGKAYQEIRFKRGGKTYVMAFGEDQDE